MLSAKRCQFVSASMCWSHTTMKHLNSFWPSGDKWHHRTWSTLVWIMWSHCLNLCWLIVNSTIMNKVQWNFDSRKCIWKCPLKWLPFCVALVCWLQHHHQPVVCWLHHHQVLLCWLQHHHQPPLGNKIFIPEIHIGFKTCKNASILWSVHRLSNPVVCVELPSWLHVALAEITYGFGRSQSTCTSILISGRQFFFSSAFPCGLGDPSV